MTWDTPKYLMFCRFKNHMLRCALHITHTLTKYLKLLDFTFMYIVYSNSSSNVQFTDIWFIFYLMLVPISFSIIFFYRIKIYSCRSTSHLKLGRLEIIRRCIILVFTSTYTQFHILLGGIKWLFPKIASWQMTIWA